MLKRPMLRHSRFYYWFVVLSGISGGYCSSDELRRRRR
jgi:hypothetical protein